MTYWSTMHFCMWALGLSLRLLLIHLIFTFTPLPLLFSLSTKIAAPPSTLQHETKLKPPVSYNHLNPNEAPKTKLKLALRQIVWHNLIAPALGCISSDLHRIRCKHRIKNNEIIWNKRDSTRQFHSQFIVWIEQHPNPRKCYFTLI